MNVLKKLDDYINDLNRFETGCLSVAISKNGEFFYSAVNSSPDVNFNDYTRLNIGEISKIYTGLLILRLIEDGEITADDRVKKYIPEFKYDNISIIHLLTETSGINTKEENAFADIKSEKQLFEKIYGEEKQNAVPGEHVSDYKYGYSVLMDIIQKVSGKSIEEYAAENIFEPLNLRKTSFDASGANSQNILMPYDMKSKTEENCADLPPLGGFGMFSNVTDLHTVASMFLDFCKERGKYPFSKNGLTYLLTPAYYDAKKQFLRTPIFLNRGVYDAYSCFGDLSSKSTFGMPSKTGCMISVDPEEDIAVTIASNSLNMGADRTVYKKIMNVIMSVMN